MDGNVAELRNQKNVRFEKKKKKPVLSGFHALIARNFPRNGDAAASANIAGAYVPHLFDVSVRPKTECTEWPAAIGR